MIILAIIVQMLVIKDILMEMTQRKKGRYENITCWIDIVRIDKILLVNLFPIRIRPVTSWIVIC